MNFKKMNSEQLTSQIDLNLDTLAYIEQSKRTVLKGLFDEGASSEEISKAVEDLDYAYSPRINDLRLENETIAKILWERAK